MTESLQPKETGYLYFTKNMQVYLEKSEDCHGHELYSWFNYPFQESLIERYHQVMCIYYPDGQRIIKSALLRSVPFSTESASLWPSLDLPKHTIFLLPEAVALARHFFCNKIEVSADFYVSIPAPQKGVYDV